MQKQKRRRELHKGLQQYSPRTNLALISRFANLTQMIHLRDANPWFLESGLQRYLRTSRLPEAS